MSSLLKKLRKWLKKYRGLAIGSLLFCLMSASIYTYYLSDEEYTDPPSLPKDKEDFVKVMAREYTVFREIDDDLSPVCKSEGYSGLSEDGVLTIFQGPPEQKQIIKTFYRMDTELLESRLPKNEWMSLKNGIRIHNVAEYMCILSTFGEFAVEY